MSDNNFFDQFDKKQLEKKHEDVPEVKTYPAWVEQTKKPEKTRVMYNVVTKLFDDAVKNIKDGTFENATEVTLSQAQVCDAIPFFKSKSRSGLKNHGGIKDLLDKKNKELAKLLVDNKEKPGKSKARKTIGMVKAELAEYKEEYVAKTQVEMDRLINSELLVTQSDALNLIAKYKKELTEVRKELAEVQHANEKLQKENFRLQQRILTMGKPKLTVGK